MPDSKRPLEPVPFTQVTLEDSFWAPRQELNRTVTLPHIYRECEAAGRIGAFDLDFQRPVPSPIVQIFGDSDPAKWLEAASSAIAARRDPALEKTVDGLADKIIRAQQPDGYLNTRFTAAQPEMRWRNLRDWHEMYCAGHLIEGAVAHHQATGSRKLLDALCRCADHIDSAFGREPGKKRGYPGTRSSNWRLSGSTMRPTTPGIWNWRRFSSTSEAPNRFFHDRSAGGGRQERGKG